MKKIFVIGTLLLAFACCFYACKKDLGNYDYSDANVITIKTDMVTNDPNMVVTADSVVLRQNDSIRVNILVSQTKPSSDLSYTWMVVQANSTLGNPSQTVIGNTQNLRAKITMVPYLYKLVVGVKDNGTGITYYKYFALNVTTAPWGDEGWVILQNQPGQNGADISVITTAAGTTQAPVYSNVYALTNNGKKLPLGTYKVNVLDYNTSLRLQKVSFFYPNGGLEVKAIDFTDSSIHSSWFMVQPSTYNLQTNGVVNTGQYEYQINNDQLYGRRVNATSIKTPPIKFGAPILGTWTLSPYLINNLSSENYYTLYDKANRCFLLYNMELGTLVPTNRTDVANSHFVPYAGGAAALDPINGSGFDMNNIRHNLLYAENVQPYSASTTFDCFFRNNAGDSTWVYQFNAGLTYANNFTSGRYLLTDAKVPGINKASLFACPTHLSNPGKFYYANSNNIYVCTVASLANSTAAVGYSFPAGTVVKAMKVLKSGYATIPTYESRVLVVATDETASGGGHKVYFLTLNASGLINSTPSSVYGGFDSITDIAFKKTPGI
ncbi:MAG TPA: PKD-like family lipoprotein [Phnomibacter sp.]|nr:PKD-like family lipoprotein [Phnomibacter sp.]